MPVPVDPNHEIGTPPYPPSPVIEKIVWEDAAHIRRAAKGRHFPDGRWDGSDNFPLTWAADGHLYTTYGDGYGFDPILPEKLGLGFARIVGGPDDFYGENIRSNAENRNHGMRGKKGSGLLCVDGVIYMWLFHADEQGGKAQLAWSHDAMRTWTFCDWMFEEFGYCTFINFGRDYRGARDHYIYVVSNDSPMGSGPEGPADAMVLMRVPKESVTERAAYEFFVARTPGGDAVWTREIRERGPVFEHPKNCLRSGISYNAAIKRYLWWQHIGSHHIPPKNTRFAGGFGIYDAPEPWGPWTTAYFTEDWDVGPGERGEFPTKWMSEDGTTLFLVFSGNDNFAVRKATLVLR